MSDLDRIVNVVISRETQAVSQASFGTFGIVSEFATDKTTATFDRYREYASLAEMAADGWSSSDLEYQAAASVFSQNPKVDKIVVLRVDSGDASITDALNSIQAATQDWYMFTIIATASAKVVFSADFVADNVIAMTVNGVSITDVDFITDQATTMQAIADQIEADLTDAVVTIDSTDPDERTLIIELDDGSIGTVTAAVTGGASQPTATITTAIISDDVLEVAAWAETQKKVFIYDTGDTDVLDPVAETDLPYLLKQQGYDRTVSCYHPNAQDGVSPPEWFGAGWAGEALPYDPGSQTWAYKTIAGVAVYSLTTAQRTAAYAKNCNVYTAVGGVSVTEEGKVASGEWIDIIRGIDWLESRLQEAVYSQLVNQRKIPFTDEGIALVETAVRGVLAEGVINGLLVDGSIVVTVPKAADVSSADKIARNLPDIDFTADLQGAIHKVQINGVVTV